MALTCERESKSDLIDPGQKNAVATKAKRHPQEKREPEPSPRLAGLDALRAGMMLLGIVLHIANAHSVGAPAWWPQHDDFRSDIFDAFTFSVHSFRMEIFFLLAGFFARLLLVRHGARGFAINRSRRVLLPLGLGLGVMACVMVSGMLPAAIARPEAQMDFPAYVTAEPLNDSALSNALQWHPWFRHLWFLEYLLIFYVGLAAYYRLFAGKEERWLEPADAWLSRAIRRPWLPLLLAAATAILLWPMRGWVVSTPLSMVPDWRLLAYYSLFIGSGWMLHRQPSVLTATAIHWNWRNGIVHLAVAVVLTALLWQAGGTPSTTSIPIALGIRLASALFTWLFVFQLLGAAMLLLNRQNQVIRYLADAAYWCYLVHLPVVLFLQHELSPHFPGWLRFPLVLGITAAISLGSYHLLFRQNPLWGWLTSPKTELATLADQSAQ
jgi:glucan biosynthesis protein C